LENHVIYFVTSHLSSEFVVADPEVIFEWRYDPLTAQPHRAVGAGLATLVIGALVALSFQSAGWGLFALLFMLGSLHRVWLPTNYRVRESGLERTQLGVSTRRPWSEFKRAVLGRNTVFLSPFAEPSRLDGHRGWLIWIKRDDPQFSDWVATRVKVVSR
jgi:hypothetical protein